MRRYTSAYVPIQNNASALGNLGALSWLAGMSAQVCAGLESSTCLNFDGDSRRMRAYALGATGGRSINSCADSRRMRTYTCAWSIKPALVVIYDIKISNTAGSKLLYLQSHSLSPSHHGNADRIVIIHVQHNRVIMQVEGRCARGVVDEVVKKSHAKNLIS